jgi:hypothetical protein
VWHTGPTVSEEFGFPTAGNRWSIVRDARGEIEREGERGSVGLFGDMLDAAQHVGSEIAHAVQSGGEGLGNVLTGAGVGLLAGGLPGAAADLPNSGARKVDNPLPAKVLDGSPCDSALTSEQLTGFLGEPSAPKAKDEALGPSCTWTSASGSGAGILVGLPGCRIRGARNRSGQQA